jgi:hypothetical protein
MRARNFRPRFDRLDSRLVLDDSAASMITGANLGSGLIASMGTGDSSDQDVVSIVDWYLPGTPPPVPADPSQITIDFDLMAN